MTPTSITVTGTTSQGAIANPTRPASEFTTGENTTVQQITASWPSTPSPEDIAEFERDYGPAYQFAHTTLTVFPASPERRKAAAPRRRGFAPGRTRYRDRNQRPRISRTSCPNPPRTSLRC